ncbi:MAG: hypothetical protein M8872_11530 [marine benthic group bacterium]|nr:hypothetical protein [Gemmatimonadota bacterium]
MPRQGRICPDRMVFARARSILTLLATCSTILLPSSSDAQLTLTSDVTSDPDQAVFSYSDIQHFIRAIEAIEAGTDTMVALQQEYFEQASPGLEMFVEKYDLTAERLQAGMTAYPEAYERLPAVLAALRNRESSFRESYAAIHDAIPGTVFPTTWFLVAGHRGIGSGSIEGPLFSIEKETVTAIEAGSVEPTLVHEMVHLQQLAATGEAYFAIFSGPERTLLALSIREGAATYFSELITGGSEHKNAARDWYLAHEDEVWSAFEAVMLSTDMGDWLWAEPANPDQPPDVGYAIGARIVESFYRSSEDKEAAAAEVMGITDYEGFLERSGYRERG